VAPGGAPRESASQRSSCDPVDPVRVGDGCLGQHPGEAVEHPVAPGDALERARHHLTRGGAARADGVDDPDRREIRADAHE
jgi:hypothetical protein